MLQKEAAWVGERSIDSTPIFLPAQSSYDALAGVRSVGSQPSASFEAAIEEMGARKRNLQCVR